MEQDPEQDHGTGPRNRTSEQPETWVTGFRLRLRVPGSGFLHPVPLPRLGLQQGGLGLTSPS